MTGRAVNVVAWVHQLASRYHWTETAILALPLPRRQAYLAMIAADHEAHLVAALLPRD